jgi:hypothetical protein
MFLALGAVVVVVTKVVKPAIANDLPSPAAWSAIVGAFAAGLGVALAGDRTTPGTGALRGRAEAVVNVVGVAVGAALIGLLAGKIGNAMPSSGSDSGHARAIDLLKAVVAIAAAGAVFYEAHRAGERRPVAERWKKVVGATLAVAAVVLYFTSFRFGYPKYYHRWDQYHYYMGAKYFPEIGYDGLYKCSTIAQDEIGKATVEIDGKSRTFDLKAEVRKSDKKIRNLSGDNLLMKVDDLLANPEQCRSRFRPERWEQYKRDVTFFATQCYVDSYWTNMQQDHGYNPPPVWTLAGYLLGNLHDPGPIL